MKSLITPMLVTGLFLMPAALADDVDEFGAVAVQFSFQSTQAS